MRQIFDAEERSERAVDRDGMRDEWPSGSSQGMPLVSDDETFDLGGAIGKDEIHDPMNQAL